MAKEMSQRQQLKQLWYKRALLSFGLLCTIGITAILVPVELERQRQYKRHKETGRESEKCGKVR